MRLSDLFTSEAIALAYTNAASNSLPYLGAGLFPAQKKAGLDLRWLKGHNGLPISLKPANFDAKANFRDRVGIKEFQTEMPFFREAMIVKERDEQEIMRVQDSGDPYAQQVLDNIFNDSTNLVNGADVVAERLRMQLLAPVGGSVGIGVSAGGVAYTYNYDPNGSWKAEHYTKIETDEDKWTAADTCDPMKNLEDCLDAQEEASGTRPELLLMSKATFNLIKNSKKVQSGVLAQNTTANVNYTSSRIKAYVEEELGVKISVYNKKYKDETQTTKNFYPDNIIMMLPNGSLGKTWYGTTPEERSLAQSSAANVSIVNTGVAITVVTNPHPVHTETIVSEIVLPSFERMDSCYALEVA